MLTKHIERDLIFECLVRELGAGCAADDDGPVVLGTRRELKSGQTHAAAGGDLVGQR